MLVEQMNKNTVKPQRGDILVGGNYDFGENMYSFQHITPLGFDGIFISFSTNILLRRGLTVFSSVFLPTYHSVGVLK
jgi:hypothetical protein